MTRNKVKRAMREAFWELSDRFPSSRDFVLVARADAAGLVEAEGVPGVVKQIEDIMPGEERST